MRRGIVLAGLMMIGGLSLAATAYQAPAGQGGRGRGQAAALQIQKVKDNLYMVTGQGGNTAAFIMANGVAVVDTKYPGNGQAILDQIKTVTDKPVTMVINTHSHGDHSGSNEGFAGNVEFVAHENTKTNMEKMPEFAGDKAAFLPKKTYGDKLTIGSGPDQVDLYYFGPAHTSGDSFVVFPALRTMHAGDVFANKGIPLIDTANGGSTAEFGNTLTKAAKTIKDVDTVINGHTPGPLAFSDLVEYAAFNRAFLDYVKAAMAANKTVDEAAAEYKIPERYVGYSMGSSMFGGYRGNIQTGYNELKK